jgi:orotidine-5'-phosphate decarboxylase
VTRQELIEHIKNRQSALCVGLDTDPAILPPHLKDFNNPVLEFNKLIIDATRNYAVAYKPNLAFYEAMGSKGWDTLYETIQYIGDSHFTIADAKRGDIGNTARMYAKTFFEVFNFDAVTVSPYMGMDSIEPFLEYEGKWVIALGLTSNPGHVDVQMLKTANNDFVFEQTIRQLCRVGSPEQLMLVVGATRGELISRVRDLAPNHFFLIPGVGAQGGNLQETWRIAANKEVGILINSSRGIIYASSGVDFDQQAGKAAFDLQIQMQRLMVPSRP